MDEVFDQRELLDRDQLRDLQSRKTIPTVWRLLCHLTAFVLLVLLVTRNAGYPFLALLYSVALSWIWAGIFAPFHECTHRTAFASRRGNALGASVTGVLFAMAPAVYRAFHFEHHRHTSDPERDPEILGHPSVYSRWPDTLKGWLLLASGYGLIGLKAIPTYYFATTPTTKWDEYAPWVPPLSERDEMRSQCRTLMAIWLLFFVVAAVLIKGGWWLIFAAWLAHVWQALWVAAEHTGLPLEGTIIERTRSVTSNPFVRWCVWNMNYHAEHHAWPGIPWHALPNAHELVKARLDHLDPSYTAVHRDVVRATGSAR